MRDARRASSKAEERRTRSWAYRVESFESCPSCVGNDPESELRNIVLRRSVQGSDDGLRAAVQCGAARRPSSMREAARVTRGGSGSHDSQICQQPKLGWQDTGEARVVDSPAEASPRTCTVGTSAWAEFAPRRACSKHRSCEAHAVCGRQRCGGGCSQRAAVVAAVAGRRRVLAQRHASSVAAEPIGADGAERAGDRALERVGAMRRTGRQVARRRRDQAQLRWQDSREGVA